MIITTDSYADLKAALGAMGGATNEALYHDLTASGGSFYVLSFYTSNGSVHAVEAELSAQPATFGTDWALTVALSGKPRLRT